MNELQKLKDFIISKKPHVIAIGAESRYRLILGTNLFICFLINFVQGSTDGV
jgi:hypothetical protein